MLNINMEDVIGVVNACRPQLIALAAALVLAVAVIIAMAVIKRIPKHNRFLIRWNAVLAFVLACRRHRQLGLSGPHVQPHQPDHGHIQRQR